MQVNNKEVRFDLYCRTCKHAALNAWENPCNKCMTIPMREGTEKPEYWEEKE